jgi:predicted RNA methylase
MHPPSSVGACCAFVETAMVPAKAAIKNFVRENSTIPPKKMKQSSPNICPWRNKFYSSNLNLQSSEREVMHSFGIKS